MGSQRVEHDLATEQQCTTMKNDYFLIYCIIIVSYLWKNSSRMPLLTSGRVMNGHFYVFCLSRENSLFLYSHATITLTKLVVWLDFPHQAILALTA